MFEVGKEYDFVTISRDESGLSDSSRRWKVVGVEGTLLHLQIPTTEGMNVAVRTSADDESDTELVHLLGPTEEQNMVLNTASAFFVNAIPVVREGQ